jgi:hypothetical protein
MDRYKEERWNILDSISNDYNNILNFISKNEVNNYSIDRMRLINKNIDNLSDDILNLKNDLELKYTKKNDKELLNRISEMNKFDKNIKLLYPYMLMLNLVDDPNDNIQCSECNKSFFGKDYLRRYRQHFNAKHKFKQI